MRDDVTSDKDCPFCAIASGRDPSAHVVAQGPEWVAFFPLEPATAGHTLVIPRTHMADVWSAPSDLAGPLMRAVMQVGQAVRSELEPQGMNLISSAGGAAEQTVFHLHLHLVPRWEGDGFARIWPDHGIEEDLGKLAQRIQAAYAAQVQRRITETATQLRASAP